MYDYVFQLFGSCCSFLALSLFLIFCIPFQSQSNSSHMTSSQQSTRGTSKRKLPSFTGGTSGKSAAKKNKAVKYLY